MPVAIFKQPVRACRYASQTSSSLGQRACGVCASGVSRSQTLSGRLPAVRQMACGIREATGVSPALASYRASADLVIQAFFPPRIIVSLSSPVHSKEVEDFWGEHPLPESFPKGLNYKSQDLVVRVKRDTIHNCKVTVSHSGETQYLIWDSTRKIDT